MPGESESVRGEPAGAPGSIHITVIGTGYVGLVTAACLATMGHRVTALDVDEAKIRRLEQAEVPFHEAGLPALLREHLASGRLRFAGTDDAALQRAEVVFVAVGTPGRPDGSTDMTAIDAVVRELRQRVRAPAVIVIKSTVPVGTTRRIQAALTEACEDGEAPRVLSNPEFLREGCAVEDFMKPDRIIVGDDASAETSAEAPTGMSADTSAEASADDAPPDDRARRLLARVYAPLTEAGVPMLTMDTRSAELSKYAANAMLAMRISFINEIAGIAAATGADIEQVRAGIGSDPRIGRHFLRPGLGYGGSCFPKDVEALREMARRHDLRSDLLLATQRVNQRQRCWGLEALVRDLGSRAALRGLRVALWGLAFKPGTDDTRDAPSLTLLTRLSRAGAVVAAYDPVATPNTRATIGDPAHVTWADSAAAALQGADVLLLATEWPEFVTFDPHDVAAALARATVYDGRNALDAVSWSAAGLRVVQVGRSAPARRRPRLASSSPAISGSSGSTAGSAGSAPAPVIAPLRQPSWIVTESIP